MVGTGRGVGVTEAFHETAAESVLALFGLVTQLGDAWLLFAIGGLFYVTGDELPHLGVERRRGLFVFGLALTYVALVGVLKGAFDLPRPAGAAVPPDVRWLPSLLAAAVDAATTADGPGFPSGHALGTSMVWGGLALTLRRWPLRRRLGAAAAVVVVVSLSRLVLGVHFLVDVLVGVSVGVVALGALYWLSDRGTDPERVLLVAAAVGVVGLLVGVTFDSVAASGGAVGGWLVWRGVAETTPAHPSDRREVVAGFLVFAVAGGLFGALAAVEPPHVVTFVGAATAVGGAVAAPLLGERLG